MRRWLAPVMVATLGALASPAGAQQAPKPPKHLALPDLPTALRNVEATYHAPEHEMWFTETYFAKAYNRSLTSQGQLVFAKPDKLTLRHGKGNLVVDGGIAGIYNAILSQYDLQRVGAASLLRPFLFLAGSGALATQCKLTLFAGWQFRYPNGYVLLCEPVGTSPFASLVYYVDAASSEVRRVVAFDGKGNSDRFDLDQVQAHPAVSPQLFSLTPPPGAVVNALPPGLWGGGPFLLLLLLRP